jgi:hypothetical protein
MSNINLKEINFDEVLYLLRTLGSEFKNSETEKLWGKLSYTMYKITKSYMLSSGKNKFHPECGDIVNDEIINLIERYNKSKVYKGKSKFSTYIFYYLRGNILKRIERINKEEKNQRKYLEEVNPSKAKVNNSEFFHRDLFDALRQNISFEDIKEIENKIQLRIESFARYSSKVEECERKNVEKLFLNPNDFFFNDCKTKKNNESFNRMMNRRRENLAKELKKIHLPLIFKDFGLDIKYLHLITELDLRKYLGHGKKEIKINQ